MAIPSDNLIDDKLTYCITNKIIPFLLNGNNDTLIITQDIMSELRAYHRIENLSGLKDIGIHLGFEYASRYINSKKKRILEGTKDNLIKFINLNVE